MLADLMAPGLRPITWNPWTTPPPRSPSARSRLLAPGIWIWVDPDWRAATQFEAFGVEIPAPGFRIPAWHEWALCAGMDVSAFFGANEGARPTLRRSELAAARRVCAGCPVKAECLSWALDPAHEESHGVWAGTSGRQRAEMTRQVQGGATAAAVMGNWFAKWL